MLRAEMADPPTPLTVSLTVKYQFFLRPALEKHENNLSGKTYLWEELYLKLCQRRNHFQRISCQRRQSYKNLDAIETSKG